MTHKNPTIRLPRVDRTPRLSRQRRELSTAIRTSHADASPAREDCAVEQGGQAIVSVELRVPSGGNGVHEQQRAKE